MHMHNAVGDQKFVKKSLKHLSDQISKNVPELHEAIGQALGINDPAKIEEQRTSLANYLNQAAKESEGEEDHKDVHFVSRCDFVGLFQSVLATIFADIPDLQGYGDKNPSWVTTIIEAVEYDASTFFKRVYTDVHGNKKPLLHSIIAELSQLRYERALYPAGMPITRPLSDNISIALMGDWGGDNDAARRVAAIVGKRNPTIGIHLGDIYYGGIKQECESFLRLWPFHLVSTDPASSIPKESSLALNGNHEMFSGGESYFNTVLPALGQPQPFFCLEHEYWRIIGLDTAYLGGHLKPDKPEDSMAIQWNWLISLLKKEPKLANIFLTHHQPVSAHTTEWNDSKPLRAEITALLSMEGIGKDAIFGWFFGHEHRCAIYQDSVLPYNARLIGNGCIPHVVQHEKSADPGCTPLEFVNRKAYPGSKTAVSSFAVLRFAGPKLAIDYCNEDNTLWGTELWDMTKGRLGGVKFVESDGQKQ